MQTSIGTYSVLPVKGGGVDVFFQRSALDRCETVQRAKARCQEHYDDLKGYLKPVGLHR